MGKDPVALLRSKRLRATPQRRAILDAFAGRADEHLSAEEIHARAVARVPGIGRGTVYATLAELTELGLLASFGSQDPVRYETNVAPHDHFRCHLCLRVFDVQLRRPSLAALERDGFSVTEVGVVLGGTCPHCQAFGNGLRDGAQAVIDGRQVSGAGLATLSCVRHETSVGPLLIGATRDGIARVVCEGHADFEPFAERARTRRGGRDARGRVDRVIGSIDRFLGGDGRQATDTVDWNFVGGGGRDALESTRAINWGDRRSYHQLGVDVAPYDCGYAMGSNPMPFIHPCHRVTRGGQVSEHYVGGAAIRQHLESLDHP